jgi:hypothetical protein
MPLSLKLYQAYNSDLIFSQEFRAAVPAGVVSQDSDDAERRDRRLVQAARRERYEAPSKGFGQKRDRRLWRRL